MTGHPPSGYCAGLAHPGCIDGPLRRPMPRVEFCCIAFVAEFDSLVPGARLPSAPAPPRAPPTCREPIAPHVPYWCSSRSARARSSPCPLSPSTPSTSSTFAESSSSTTIVGPSARSGVSPLPSPTSLPANGRPMDLPLQGRFKGSYRCASWNARGLLVYDLDKQNAKREYLAKLLQSHDMVALQETHTTPGNAAVVQLPVGTVPLWSHCSRRQGGIGLVLQAAFLRNFAAVAPDDWEILDPGRLAVLRLRGLLGALSMAVGYFPSGHLVREERRSPR